MAVRDYFSTCSIIYTPARKCAQIINKHAATINMPSPMGRTVLTTACMLNKRTHIKELIRAGADMHVRDVYSFTVLDFAHSPAIIALFVYLGITEQGSLRQRKVVKCMISVVKLL